MPNPGLKLTRLARSFWKRQRNFPKFSPAPQQWEAGQLSHESLDDIHASLPSSDGGKRNERYLAASDPYFARS
jgi:hypothetical protein